MATRAAAMAASEPVEASVIDDGLQVGSRASRPSRETSRPDSP